jgi:hypothetical protein
MPQRLLLDRVFRPDHIAGIVFDRDAWRSALTDMVRDFGKNGIVFNCWNGYTEGMAAVPTRGARRYLLPLALSLERRLLIPGGG